MADEAKVQLRIPRELRDWFATYSKQASRSMNGQMIELIKEKQSAQKEKAPNA